MKSSACPSGGLNRRSYNRGRGGWLATLILFSVALAGCQSTSQRLGWPQLSYQPNNVFVYPPKLSSDFHRVAVLPLAAETSGASLPEGCAALSPVLWDQLVKAKKFEVVAVDPAALRSGTGQAAWTGGEALPPEFLAWLRREYDCDGVLFAELTTYRAYAPLAVGWRFKLVDVRSGRIIWAADELFDAARPSVAAGVERFNGGSFSLPFHEEENWLALNSPREFGRYSAAALLKTLPDR